MFVFPHVSEHPETGNPRVGTVMQLYNLVTTMNDNLLLRCLCETEENITKRNHAGPD